MNDRLEILALRYLRWQARCPVVVFERGPREVWTGRPDVLGITQSRYMIEIEIKRSPADFRADAGKRCRLNRDVMIKNQPRQFFYLADTQLAERILGEIPAWAGLIAAPELRVMKRAPTNRESRRLTVRECLEFVKKLSNQLISHAEARYHGQDQDQEYQI